MQKYSIKNFEKEFPDDEACLEWLKNNRWPDGIHCIKCQRITKHYKVSNRSAYACEFCGNHIYPMVGTILEHSSTELRKWFHAMFLMSTTRCGISAAQLQREIGVTYKTAWRMFKQIRSMLNEDIMKLLGEVEVDETYIGGRQRGKRGRGAANKTIVIGAVERNGKVIARVVPNIKRSSFVPFIAAKVSSKNTVLYTDEFPSYDHMARLGYNHKRIEHSAKIYVNGNIHTNTIEGFWSLVKRGIDGVHHVVGANYLQDYINAYAFRWNHRNDEKPMFLQILARLVPSLRA